MKNSMQRFIAVAIAIIMTCGLLSWQTPVSATASAGNDVPVGFVDESKEFLDELLEELEAIQQENSQVFSFSTTAVPVKADVVFVIDTTGSMSSYIANVKNNIAIFAKALSDMGVTLRVGIVEFKDITADGLDSTKVHTVNYSPWMGLTSFVTTLNSLSVYGGGDNPETPIDALGYLVDGSSMLWSTDAYKFAIVLTDDTYKNNNRHGYANLSSVVGELAKQGISTSVITSTSYFSDYTPLTSATNGILANINSSNFSNVLEELAQSVMGMTNKAKKAIYILPGYLGSELYDSTSKDAKRLWDDVHYIPIFDWLQREHDQLINNNSDGSGEVAYAHGKDIIPNGKDDYGTTDIYEKLVKELKKQFDKSEGGNYDVKFFPYNWLGDINETVKKLEEDAKSYNKIALVTHSTGGLVASAYVAKSRENRLKIEKLVLVAPPLYGTYASLFPLERGDSPKGLSLIDVGTNNNWVKKITHNSPTTYQLLPSKEYFDTTHALDLRTENNLLNDKWTNNAGWTEFYKTLNGSSNINNNLLSSSSNSRSHKSFRENNLNGGYSSILSCLNSVNTTVIGTGHGKSTPKIAQYDISKGYDKAKLVDIKYDKAGDGTVYNTSLGITLNNDHKINSNVLHTISWYGGGAPDHTGLIKDNDVINDIVKLLQRSAGLASYSTAEFAPFSLTDTAESIAAESEDIKIGEDATMEDYVKLRIESEKEITVKVFDESGAMIASCDSQVANGFDGNEFICDRFGDDGETLTSIYLPKQGYRVCFYYGDQPDVELSLTVKVHLLDDEGDYITNGVYASDITISEGEVFSLDMVKGVTKDNFDKLASTEYYPNLIIINADVYATEWDFDLSEAELHYGTVLLNSIGDTVSIGIVGTASVEWSSSDESVVTVNDGTVTAVSYGTASISASATDGSGKVKLLNVKVILRPSAVTFDNVSIMVNERYVVQPLFDSPSVSERDIIYEYDSDIISIENGVIIGLLPGNTVVKGTTLNGISSTFSVTVTSDEIISVQSVYIEPSDITIGVGEKFTFSSQISPANATNQLVDWFTDLSSPFEIVNSEGNTVTIKGLEEGSAELTIVTQDGGYVATALVTVKPSKHEHNYTKVISDAICTEQGYSTYTCECGDEYIDDYIAAFGHDWNDGIITIEPTETEFGEITYTCLRCNEMRTVHIHEIDSEHDYMGIVTSPSCTEQGYTIYTCGDDSYIDDYVAALGHDYTVLIYHKDATHSENGYNTFGCSRCDASRTEVIPSIKRELEKISITSNANKTTYTVGETLNLSGMIVVAYYIDGSENIVTDYTSNPENGTILNTSGTRTITISYTENEIMKTVSYNVTVNPVQYYDNGGSNYYVDNRNSSTEVTDISDIETPLAAANPFADVSTNDWFIDSVLWAYFNNYMIGVSTDPMLFSPNTPATRGMIVTILYRIAGEPDVKDLSSLFNDVVSDKWYYNAVIWATANGIVSGYGNGKFGPENNITRQDLAVILSNYSDFASVELPQLRNYTVFNNDTDIANYAKDAVVRLFEAMIISGNTDESFDPKGVVTRAELAAILKDFLKTAEQ